MNRLQLQADVREISGRKVKSLRGSGIIPANIFGSDIESLAIQVQAKEFLKVFAEAGETGLIDVAISGAKRPVLVHDVTYHPVSSLPIHIDFRQVNLKEEITANVPVEIIGESPAEKQGIGTVVQVVNELAVTALPDQLPQSFVVDISSLTEIDQAIMVSDLSYDKEHVTIDVENPEEMVIVKVDELTKEEPVEVQETTDSEPAAPETTESAPTQDSE